MEVIARNLFTILNCEYMDDRASRAYDNLKKLVDSHEFELAFESDLYEQGIMQTSNMDVDYSERTSYETYKKTLNYVWIHDIYKSVCDSIRKHAKQSKKNKNVENLYFTPHLKEYFLRLFVRAPLWSNIMCPQFKSLNKIPTSSGNESNFKNVKHLLNRPYRVDKFVKFHLEHLSGYMKQHIAEHNDNSTKDVKSLKPHESSVTYGNWPKKNKCDFVSDWDSEVENKFNLKKYNSEPDLLSTFDESK